MDPGVDSATLSHDNRAHVLISAVIGLLVVTTFAVGLRIYTRAFLLKQVGADDYLSILSLTLAFATAISQCINTQHGLGKHSWDLKAPGEVVAYLKNFFVSIALYNTGLMVVKLTFLTQYYRVLVLRRFRIICVITMIVVGCWSFSQVLVGIFICRPLAGFWDSTLNPKCIPTPLQWYINAAGNIFTDVVIFIMPLPVLTHLKLPRAQRVLLVGIFSLGFFTCAISVIRIKYLKQGGDFSYENIEASSWSIAELCSGVICCSLPTLRPFVSKYIPAFASRIQRSSAGYLRHSGSRATDVGRRSIRHAHHGSKESNGDVGIGSEGSLYPRDYNYNNNDNNNKNIDTYNMSRTTTGDTSDGIIGLRSTKESLFGAQGHGHSRNASNSNSNSNSNRTITIATPKATHVFPGHSRNASSTSDYNKNLSWLQPSVTTTISTGGCTQPNPLAMHRLDNGFGGDGAPGTRTRIQITRDVMMQNLSFPSSTV